MTHRVAIERADDERLADYVRLRDASLRRRLETERGVFIAEGAKVIRRALAAGYRPRSLLLAERWLADLEDVLVHWPAVPVYVVSEALAEEVTGFHVHRGALASLHREDRWAWTDLLHRRRLVVIEDVVDHTNVGAILRNAAGLGWDGVLLSPRAADPLYRRAIKVSMGAVFSLPWARLPDWGQAPTQLREAGFLVVALGLGEGALPIAEIAAAAGGGVAGAAAEVAAAEGAQAAGPRRIAVLLGTEGAGLSKRWLSQADVVATIGMHADIDSLNVAAASAVACYVLGPH